MSSTLEAPKPGTVEACLDFFGTLRNQQQQQRVLAQNAPAALERLVEVCAQKTGQGYTLRNLLYSLWNGQKTSLLEIVSLDWPLRQDLMIVLTAFGFEGGRDTFFYDQVSDAFKAAGLFDWFTSAHKEGEGL